MKEITYVLIGAGQRGRGYSACAEQCENFRMVAVAEPIDDLRNFVKEKYNLPEEMCFRSYDEMNAKGKLADIAMICTQDRMHVDHALKAIELGYELILEKPIAPTPEECALICNAAEEKGVRVLVCHVLRYSPFCRKLKELIASGIIGKIQNVIHYEGVGVIHYSHSFVRGNWGNSQRSSNMLLAKSCHDLDLLQWLLDAKCTKVQSFGSQTYFNQSNCPEGAPKRCVDGCPVGETCPYNAVKIYRDMEFTNRGWMRSAAAHKTDPTEEDLEHVIRDTNYGICVFQSDNDVVDHQVVNLEYDNGETVSFTMSAFNRGGRRIHVMGTKGDLISTDFNTIEVNLFRDTDPNSETYGRPKKMFVKTDVIDQSIVGGHGGGDGGLIEDAWKLFLKGEQTISVPSIRTSTENHLTVFAAEESRKNGGQVVDVKEYFKQFLNKKH